MLYAQGKGLIHKRRHTGLQIGPRQLQMRIAGVFEHQHAVGFADRRSRIVQHRFQSNVGGKFLSRRAVAVPEHRNAGHAVQAFPVGILLVD